MSLILEQGFSIKRGKEEDFQKWLAENDELTRKSAPEGAEYLGTYIVWAGSDRKGGEYRTLWRLDSFAAFDRMDDAARDPESDWGRISREATEYMDLPIGAEGSFAIYKPVSETVIWDIS